MSHRYFLQFTLLALFTVFNVSTGQTSVTVDVLTNTSWNLAGSPFTISSSISVKKGAILTIDSNVVVNIESGGTLTIADSAKLMAKKVTFSRAAAGEAQIVFASKSSGIVDSCFLTNVYIYCNGPSTPSISNSRFTTVTYPVWLNDGAIPGFSGNSISGASNQGIKLSGNVNRSWTIPNYGLPYFVDGDVRLYASNCSLTLADGNTFNFLGSSVLYSYSTNTFDTLRANNVTFNRSGTGSPAIEFDGTGTGSITNCTLTGMAIGVQSGSPTITNNTLTRQSRAVAIYVNGSGSPVVGNNTITGYTYPYSLNDGATINLSGNTISGNTYTGIALGGNVNRNWIVPNYGLPYYVDGNVRLYVSNCKLTLADGNTLNFLGSNVIYTYSSNTCDTLKANNVTFNRIGTGTPAVEFDGTGTGSITNCTFTGVALGVGSGSPSITSNAFTGQARTVAIYVNGPGSPVVTSNTISGYTYPYSLNDGATINLGANTISGNTYTGIALGGNVSRSWTIPNYGLPYYVDASVRLYESNCKLTVADGNTLNFLGSNVLYTYSSNTCDTLKANNVTFSRIGTGTPDVEFDGSGTGTITNCTFIGVSLGVQNGSPTITNNTFTGQARTVAIYVNGPGSAIVGSNTIAGYTYPYSLNDGATINLVGNTISGNTYSGIALGGNVNRSWTIPNYGLPYYVDGSVRLYVNNCKLAVADGNTVNFLGSNELYTYSNNTYDTLWANNVTFNRIGTGSPDVWFGNNATGAITNCTFNGVVLGIDGGSPSISTNTFVGQGINTAIRIEDPGSPAITNNTMSGVTYPYWMNDGARPIFSGNNIGGAVNQGIKLAGDINRSWTIPNYGLPYFVDGNFRLYESNCKLTIAEGDTINFPGSSEFYASSNCTGDTIQAINVTFQRIGTGSPDVGFYSNCIGYIKNSLFKNVKVKCYGTSKDSLIANRFEGAVDCIETNNTPSVGIVRTDFCVSTSNYGVKNLNTANVVMARNNYWGHSTGPQHATNPSGLGVKVTDGVDFGSWSSSTGVNGPPSGNNLPTEYQLEQNFPNPFNPTTIIQYALPEKSNVRIGIFGITGNLIAQLKDGIEEAGWRSVTWDGKTEQSTPVASGVYFCRIVTVSTANPQKKFSGIKKMLLLK